MISDKQRRKLYKYYEELSVLGKMKEENPSDENWEKYYRKLKQIKYLLRYGD